MKAITLLFLLGLVACTPRGDGGRVDAMGEPLKIDPTRPPDGAQLIQVLLENQSAPLKGTLCESGAGDGRRVQHKLAMLLGDNLDNPRVLTSLSAGCRPDWYALPSGKRIDAWRCNLAVLRTDKKNPRSGIFTSASIEVGITLDDWRIVPAPEALFCL